MEKSPLLMGKSTTINGSFSIAMLNYQRVLHHTSSKQHPSSIIQPQSPSNAPNAPVPGGIPCRVPKENADWPGFRVDLSWKVPAFNKNR